MSSPPSTGTDDRLLAEMALEGDARSIGAVMTMLRSPELAAALRSRGATSTEADDILGDLAGDCFGGERSKGGLHRLLGRYNGTCPLPAFLRHVALNRLISLKRKQAGRREVVAVADDDRDPLDLAVPLTGCDAPSADDSLIRLLRGALLGAIARVDPEKLVVVRLIESYGVPQKRVGELWGWHESKISRAKSDLLDELRTAIVEEIRKADPWLHLEWEDFIALCGESADLFGS